MLYMTYTATISSKGQITLPAEIRRSLALNPGDKITIVKHDGSAEIKASSYDAELQELRQRARAHMKRNGTWGTPWEEARNQTGEVRLREYGEQHGAR